MQSSKLLQSLAFSGVALVSTSSQAVTEAEFKALQDQLNQLADAVERSDAGDSRTHVGGYGELHYNSLSGGTGPHERELDFHRFVLFFNHEFSSNIRFFSELELEHSLAGDGKPGEVELEQAYIQFDLSDNSQLNAGLFLIPVGILNETHEPTTFYGTERNPVEKNIIPTTWWEGGLMLSGQSDSGFSYDLALHSGLNAGTNIRSGRQKVAEANARNLAVTGRVKYTGSAGLELAASVQVQDDLTQDPLDNIDGATLVETHAVWNTGGFTAKALYARWDIDGVGAETAGEDTQDGGYLEVAYKLSPSFGVFARHNVWDNGGTAIDTEKAQSDVGINYWPHEDVVVKLDYQAQDENAGDSDGVNLGIGYQF